MASPFVRAFAAWMLLCAYVASAAAGPLGVLLCRDASGQTHVEWKGDADPCGAVGAIQTAPPLAATCDDSACEAGACVDEPLPRAERLVMRDDEPRPDSAGGGHVAAALPGDHVAAPKARTRRNVPRIAGPPGHVGLAMRTTVLRL